MFRGLPILLLGCSAVDADAIESCAEAVQFIGPADPVPMGWTAQRALVAFAGERQSASDAGLAVRVLVRHEGGLVQYIQSEGGFAAADEPDPWSCRSRLAVEVEVEVFIEEASYAVPAVLEVAEPVTSSARARVVGEGLGIERTSVEQSGFLGLDGEYVEWAGSHPGS